MSSRKVFQASSRPKISQANTTDTNLKKIDSNQTKAKRRKGIQQIEGLGDLSVEAKHSKDTGRSDTTEVEKLPELSPRKESPRLKRASRVKKVNVKGEQLRKPMGLKQRKIPSLFTKKKENLDDEDPLSIADIEHREVSSNEEEEGIDGDGSLTLTARLMGLPGNLDMAEEMTSKYFGIEGRTKFHNRVSWVANQREKCCLDPEEFQHTLVYEEPFHGKALHNQIPFGATRQAAAAELRGDLQEPSSGSHGGGGKFFDRFKDPALQAQAGIGFNSRSGRLDGYVNNEDAMLRTSRMRSGDDPRDEEEEDANFPLRAQARQADMDEDYMQMLRSEAKKQNSGSLIRNERVVVSPIKVNCQTSASTGKMGIEESKVDVAPR